MASGRGRDKKKKNKRQGQEQLPRKGSKMLNKPKRRQKQKKMEKNWEA